MQLLLGLGLVGGGCGGRVCVACEDERGHRG